MHEASDIALAKPVTRNEGSELGPFWQVDLEGDYLIRRVVISHTQQCGAWLRRLRILTSHDAKRWQTVFRRMDDFGQNGEPYVAHIDGTDVARHVRVQMDASDYIYFSECQVFGERAESSVLERFRKAEEAIAEYGTHAREGSFATIGEFEIFIDRGRYSPRMISALTTPYYDQAARNLVRQLVDFSDRVIDIGTAVGVTAMTVASLVGAENVLAFEANPHLIEDARKNFRRNSLERIDVRNGILQNRAHHILGERAAFHIHKDFWASSLSAPPTTEGIVEVVHIPSFCLEDEIDAHRANVLVCNIEGGEVELLADADLSKVRLIILETHCWAVGRAPTDAMMRKLILSGFNIDLALSAHERIALRR